MRREKKYNDVQLNSAVEELSGYRELKHQIAILSEKLSQYEETYTEIKAVACDQLKVQGGKQYDKLVQIACDWADMTVLLEEKKLESERTLWYLKEKLNKLDRTSAKVLEYYYIDGYEVNKIALIMSYSYYWIRELKLRALEKYSKI